MLSSKESVFFPSRPAWQRQAQLRRQTIQDKPTQWILESDEQASTIEGLLEAVSLLKT